MEPGSSPWLIEHSNRLTGEAVGSLSLQILKTQLDMVLSTPLQVRGEKIWGRTYCCLQLPNGKVHRKMEPVSSKRCTVKGQERMSTSWNVGNSVSIDFFLHLGKKKFSMSEIRDWNRGPETVWTLHPWRYSKLN
ncbi:hypothetical protein QYF61_022813 [Mycteria americana]|uniref:Uncharacterized protein n=1 Tax=Mycteria americana TaxID=33587 RepID=A0AAN7PTD8_MYCAM|nr:hypothetical protein QYF61_022813 [Mycteria americana]